MTALLAQADARVQGGGLFSAVGRVTTQSSPAAPQSFSSTDPTTIRSRLVRIDFGQLQSARAADARTAVSSASLTLNLFDDAVYSATVERAVPTASGYALTGSLDSVPLGTLTLVVNGSAVAGTVRSPAATYTIRSAGNGLYVIREVDLSQLAPEAEPLAPPPVGTNPSRPPAPEAPDPPPPQEGAGLLRAAPPRLGQTASGVRRRDTATAAQAARAGETSPGGNLRVDATPADDGSVIDVIVFYTPAARASEGGKPEIEALIDLFVTQTNQGFADSGVTQRINLVLKEEVAYTEAARITTDLNRMRNKSDGYIDEIHAIRDVHAADIVHLIIDDGPGGSCGIAGIMTDVSHDSEWWAGFGLTGNRCDDLTFSHELGHNFGLRHDRYHEDDAGDLSATSADTNKPYPYSYGYVNQKAFRADATPSTRWRTIMAYATQCRDAGFGCERIARFSNAQQTWNGDPLGVAGDEISYLVTGPADARRSLDDTRMTVANFRASGDRAACTYRVAPNRQVVLAEAGTFQIMVTAKPGCGWNAESNDPFLSVTSGARGTGRGTVSYAVTANSGTRRNGTLIIAGQTVAINQIGPNTPGICTRTRQVHEAIASDRGVACWEVTDAHLAHIESLDLSRWGLTALLASDLAGLTNLEELYLSDNQLTTLPAGVLAGLTRLRVLWLHRNQLTALPATAFAGLGNLQDLTLSTNRLAALPDGVFGDLAKLEELHLRRNRLTGLPAGAFTGLGELRELSLGTNQIDALPEDVFADLVSLEYLSLVLNQIAELPVGVFGGLVNLRELVLYRNRIPALPPSVFSDLIRLERLLISSNQLASLPAGIFAGLNSLRELTLYNNPGAPFPLMLRLERTDADAAIPGRATLAVGVDLGAPFEMPVSISATGGALSSSAASVPAGGTESAPIIVTQAGTAPVTVQLGPAPAVPAGFRGVSTQVGPPLVLFGINQPPMPVGKLADLTLEVGTSPVSVDLGSAFEDPDGGLLTYAAISSVEEVARVAVLGSVATVTPLSIGTAVVTVTATDVDGASATQVFTVTVTVGIDYDTDDDGLIEIQTLAQLDAVRYDSDGDGNPSQTVPHAAAFPAAVDQLGCPADTGCKGYEQLADLDFDTNGNGRADSGDAYWNGGAGWEPIPFFEATFDGNGQAVSNLFVERGDSTGVFGAVGGSAVIRHVGVIDAEVTGSIYVGGLVGRNEGTVSGCYVTGHVRGVRRVGGLVGQNDGVVQASYATASVSDAYNTGGLVGRNGGTIRASYATGRVAGTRIVGALVGNNIDAGTVTASYTTARVSHNGRTVGGVVAQNLGTVTASYWDTRTSGRASGHGEGWTTAALQAPTSYSGIYSGWNVDLDGDGIGDAPWDFGTAAQYPVLVLDLDGNGQATWQEMGHQLRAGPVATAAPAAGRAEVVLTWTAVDASAWTPAPEVTYTVTREAGSMAETVAATVRGVRYVDTDIEAGRAYKYQVAAVIDGGEAARSAVVTSEVPVPCVFTVTPLHRDVLWTAGVEQVTVTTAPHCAWTAASESGFLAVTAGTSAAGSAVVSYTVAANAGDPRTGSLVVAGHRVTVFQASPTQLTDQPIERGVTPVRAIHFRELRARIDTLRGREGLAPFGWTDPPLTVGVTPITGVHLTELRAALAEAYSAAARRPPDYADPVVTAGRTVIKAEHMMELRAAVAALE